MPSGDASSHPLDMARSTSPASPADGRWIILIARGEDELYEHLSSVFESDRKVEVVMDRRRNERRDSAKVAEGLRARGVAVIRRAS